MVGELSPARMEEAEGAVVVEDRLRGACCSGVQINMEEVEEEAEADCVFWLEQAVVQTEEEGGRATMECRPSDRPG